MPTDPPGTGASPSPPHPQPRRVQDAAGRLELAAGTAGERGGQGTTRWQQRFASGSGACGGGCQPGPGADPRAGPPLPAPAPFPCLPRCPPAWKEGRKGSPGVAGGRGLSSASQHSGTSGFGVRKDTKGPWVSSLGLSFPTPAFTSPAGSPRPSSLHHTAAQLTGKMRARDLEKPTPDVPWRLSHPPQTLGHPRCPRVPRAPSPAPSWCRIWAPSALRAVSQRLMERLWLATNGLAKSWGIASVGLLP